MTYSSNAQLPEAVRNALDEDQQTEWRDVFNSAYEGTCARNDECASKISWSQMKKHARHFAGWATAEVIDKQGDKLEIDAFKKTMKKFMDLGAPLIDQHSNRKVGSYIGYEFRNKGDVPSLWVEGVIYKGHRIHDATWEKIQKGEYPAMSIGADPLEKARECNEKMCWNAIKKLDLFEISVVDNPANGEATIEEVNHMAKSHSSDDYLTKSDNHNTGDTMAEEPQTTEKEVDGGGAPAVEPTVEKTDFEAVVKELVGTVQKLAADVESLKNPNPPEEEEEEEEIPETEEKGLSVEDIQKAVKDTVQEELRKMAADRPADTPRPDLKKHELGESSAQKLSSNPDKLAKMSISEIDNLIDGGAY